MPSSKKHREALKKKVLLDNEEDLLFIRRGNERIRTAVAAFAELSLATRPRYRDLECKHTQKTIVVKLNAYIF